MYAARKELKVGFEDALVAVEAALKAQGFGVVTTLPVSDILLAKLGEKFRKYRVLGACNPKYALQALKGDLTAGLLLPCNVAVYEQDDGTSVVLAVDPVLTVSLLGDGEAMGALAAEVRNGLVAAVVSL